MVILAGFSLLLDVGAKEVLGLTLLGLAATWGIGSIPRPKLSLKSRKFIATGLIVLFGMMVLFGNTQRSEVMPGDVGGRARDKTVDHIPNPLGHAMGTFEKSRRLYIQAKFGDPWGAAGRATVIITVLLGLLFSVRWRMRLAYGHLPPVLQKVKRRKAGAITLVVLLCYWAFLSLVIMGELGPIPGIIAFTGVGIGFWATLRWLRRLKKREEDYYKQLYSTGDKVK